MIIKEVMANNARGYQWVWRPVEGAEYFPAVLGLGCFDTGRSDYDARSDEAYCPCGATLSWPSGNVADLVQICEAHIAEAHPGVRR
jgi:hypothetical protein